MKKFILILITVVAIGIMSANAQTAQCKIKNPTEAGATVVGSIISTDEKGITHLTFSSDESEKYVNVKYKVIYRTEQGGGGTAEGTVLVGPNQSTRVSVEIGKSSKAISLYISGARCEE